ncbi:MAG: hypothetical protein KDH92_01320 [Chloroflexi bacterium]|nr:hypothetical protein [Chloroflexota bacterium]
MLRTVDLARLAEEMEAPYRPERLASVGSASASLFVCDDLRSWHRSEPEDTLLLVLEGVLVLESGASRAVANDGEVFAVPRKHGHNLSAGMRSSVVLFGTEPADVAANGHMAPPYAPASAVEKVNVAVGVLQGQPFEWLPLGGTGACQALASRLWGASLPYTPADDCLLIVYRGVLDYTADGERGTVVGSQMLAIPAGTTLRFDSERGATVLLLVHAGARLPEALSSGAPSGGADRAEST